MNRETMTSEERIKAVIKGEKPDRVPVFPLLSGFSGLTAGISVGDFYADPEKSFRAHCLNREMYGYDLGLKYGYATMGAWEVGGEIRFPYGKYEQGPNIVRHPWEDPEELEKYEVPEDVSRCGYIPLALRFYDAVLDTFPDMPYTVALGTSFTRIGNAIGSSLTLRWMRKKPELVHLALRKMTDFLDKMADVFVQRYGASNFLPFIGEALATNQLISPAQFEEFALPYIIEANERLMAKGVNTILTHICGDQNLNVPHWKKVNFGRPGIVNIPPEVPLEVGIEAFGADNIVTGGPSPAVLLSGTPEEVYEDTRKAIYLGKESPRGFMLMPGCEFPVNSPPINMYYMMKAVRDHGFYD